MDKGQQRYLQLCDLVLAKPQFFQTCQAVQILNVLHHSQHRKPIDRVPPSYSYSVGRQL